jgi:hypothetical protein
VAELASEKRLAGVGAPTKNALGDEKVIDAARF